MNEMTEEFKAGKVPALAYAAIDDTVAIPTRTKKAKGRAPLRAVPPATIRQSPVACRRRRGRGRG